MEGIDAYTQQALGILTDSKLGDALDLSKEDPRDPGALRQERRDVPARRRAADGRELLHRPAAGRGRRPLRRAQLQPLGLARRRRHELPEVAASSSRCSITGLSALVTDLHERGLDKDVSVVVWGEFGRTPQDQQDEQPRPLAAGQRRVLAGGGMRTGQVIGETNRYGEVPVKRPVKFQEVFATLYHNLGLDAHRDRVFDGSGTPRYPVDSDIEPMHELI